jgi:PTS system mannose-specific IIA component
MPALLRESMNAHILIIAHAPLAQALRECAMHVFPDAGESVAALDVQAQDAPEYTLAQAKAALRSLGESSPTLVLTDVVGATPANVAQQLVDGQDARLVAGVNLPMLLRSICYRQEPLDDLVARAVSGGTQGVVHMGCANTSSPHLTRA